MKNPWLNLRKTGGEYIAECDREHITPTIRNALAFDTLPWPYMGDLEKATVCVLTKSTIYEDALGAEKIDKRVVEKSLVHSYDCCLPIVTLDPKFRGASLQEWWRGKLRGLISETSEQDVSRSMFVAQYVPYSHYRGRLGNPPTLPSQRYTISLVRKAMEDEKIIILIYPKRLWYEDIPELKIYGKCYTLVNPLHGITRRNVNGDGNFDNIIKAVDRAKGSDR